MYEAVILLNENSTSLSDEQFNRIEPVPTFLMSIPGVKPDNSCEERKFSVHRSYWGASKENNTSMTQTKTQPAKPDWVRVCVHDWRAVIWWFHIFYSAVVIWKQHTEGWSCSKQAQGLAEGSYGRQGLVSWLLEGVVEEDCLTWNTDYIWKIKNPFSLLLFILH